MGKKQKAWARRQRKVYLDLYGNKCAQCGEEDPTKLEFDCIHAQGDAHHKHDTSARMSFYRIQSAAGNLQVLCTTCNAKKGNIEKKQQEESEPF